MKLQKLASPKFKAFEKNIVSDLSSIAGGTIAVMSSSTGSSGNRYDCADPTGSLGTSSGDWSNVGWHSGSAPMGYSSPCAAIVNHSGSTFLDPKIAGNVLTDIRQIDVRKSKFRF
ncbi:MAG: hypothetical protein ACO1G5_00880 [Bacteroidota bacterium]